MKPLTIVSDIDDVLQDFLGPYTDEYYKCTGIPISVSQLREYDFPEEVRRWLKICEQRGLYASLPMEFGARAFVDLLYKNSIKLVLITARPEEYRRDTEINLSRNGVYYDRLIFAKNKDEVIQSLKASYNIVGFVDDRASTVLKVTENCNLPFNFLIEKPHNRYENITNSGIIRVQNVLDVWSILRGYLVGHCGAKIR